jgi:predicted RND superfamily exporter protein
LKLNFCHFLALPITFGIGVDYAVNLMQRYVTDGEESILASVRTTGGAIVLCSLTTIVGYLALIRSVNQAIRSLGILAVSGEVTCLAAAMIGLPAILLWRERRRSVLPPVSETIVNTVD